MNQCVNCGHVRADHPNERHAGWLQPTFCECPVYSAPIQPDPLPRSRTCVNCTHVITGRFGSHGISNADGTCSECTLCPGSLFPKCGLFGPGTGAWPCVLPENHENDHHGSQKSADACHKATGRSHAAFPPDRFDELAAANFSVAPVRVCPSCHHPIAHHGEGWNSRCVAVDTRFNPMPCHCPRTFVTESEARLLDGNR